MLKILSAILLFAAFAGATVNPTVVPDASQNGVTVGPGWDDAAVRQLIRTEANVVYVIASDDDPCQIGTTSHGVIHAYKGSGAQAQNPLVPTSFAEVDAAHHPIATNAGSCVFTGNFPALGSPDIRYDTTTKTIHVLYTDSGTTTLYYQTFSTVTDTWSTRVSLATNANGDSGNGWVRQNQVALTLDINNIPHILYATSGTANTLRYANRIGGVWSAFTTLASGTNITHPSMVTALDGSLHAAWLSNALATHAVVQYSHYTGTWSAPETVDTGGLVLANGNGDQGPSIATDLSSLPHVLYLVGTVSSADDDVRVRYRTAGGVWTNNTPPSTAGGAPSATGTWFTHTPQNYISSVGDGYVVLGHDVNISPIVFEYQLGGIGNNWHAAVQADPRNQTNTTAGGAGIDGSASVRFDPLRDNNPTILDVLYYDENDGTAGYDHHATLFYKAFVLATGTTRLVSTTGSNVGTCAVNPCLTITYAYGQAAAGDTVQVAPGTYAESLNLNKAGSSGNLITVQGYPVGGSCPTTPQTDAESPISTRTAPTVNINGATLAASFNTLDCFHLPTGININTGVNSSNVLNNYVDSLPNLTNVGVNFTLTFAGRPTNIHVSHNYIHATQYGMMIMADNSLFDFNEVDALTLPSSSVDDCDYNRLWGDSDTFRRNYYHGTTKGSSGTCKSTQAHNDGWQVFSDSTASTWFSRNMTFDGNTVDNFDEGFILSNDTSVANYYNTWTIVNNVIVNSTSWCGTFDSRDLHVIFMNNVCWGGNAQLRIIDDWDAFATATMQVSNNLFDGMSSFLNGSYFYSSTGGTLLAGSGHNIQRDIGFTLSSPANSVGDLNNVNPQLVSPSSTPGAGNYSIASTSPARGFATNVGLTTDHQGNPRPSGATGTGFDSGAYQFSTSAPTTFGISGIISSLSGNAATVTLSGAGAGSTTTDGSGNYSFNGLSNGTYTITPSRTGYTFSPTSQNATVNSANITGLNFTATALQSPVPTCSPSGGIYKSGRLINCTNAVSAATICWRIGSAPTTNGNGTCTAGTTYTAPFMVSATGTLFVTGTQSGNTDSSTSYSFTINPTWTTGWVMNSAVVGRTTFGGNGVSWLGSTRIDVVQPPATPDFGGLTKNNIIRQDTSYGLPSPPDVARCTDANFDSSLLNRTFEAGIGGSGSAMGLWNANSTALRIENTGGSAYITIFDPVAMTCGARLTTGISGGAFDWNDPTAWYNVGSTVRKFTIDFTAKTLTAGATIADFSLGVPLGSNVQPWVTGTVYAAGSYVSKVYPAPDWIANKSDYVVGDIIQPSTGNPQNCAFKLSTIGTTAASAHTGTFWSNTNCVAASNTILTDGTAKWRNLGGPPGFVYQLKSCVAPCRSGATFTLPSNPDLNTTVNDGALTWTNVGPNSTFLATSFAGVSRDGTRFCTAGSTNEYGFEGDYTFQGGQDSGQWMVCYNTTANEYTLLNTATGWQSKTTCSGGTGFDCSGGTITLNPVGQSTPMASCGLFSHNAKGSNGMDYVVITHNNNVPTGCSGAGSLAFWSPFQAFSSTTAYQGFTGLAPNHWAPGHHTLVNIGQSSGVLGGFTAGAYSEIADFRNPAATYTTSWQPTCGALPLPPCGFGSQYDQHMGWAYNPTDSDDTPVFGTVYNLPTNSPIPVAPWQAEEVGISTIPRWSDTANPNAAQKQYRFTHTFNSGTNTAFPVQFAVSQVATDGRFMAFGSDMGCSLGNTAGTGTTLCGLQWRTNTVYAFGVNGTMVNPFSNNNGSGTNFGVWRVTTAGNLNGLSGTAPDWTPGALTCNTANAGMTTLDGNNVQYTCLGSSNARGDVFVVRLRR